MFLVKTKSKETVIEHKCASAAGAISILGKQWQAMTDVQKKPYVDMSIADGERHKAQVAEMVSKGYFMMNDGTKSTEHTAKVKLAKRTRKEVVADESENPRKK